MMVEFALEHAGEELARLASEVERGSPVVLTRNGREVARLTRADEPAPNQRLTGEEAVRRFERLQRTVRDHWPDEPEFDWKEAVEFGRL